IENGRVYGEIHPHRSDYGGTRPPRFLFSPPPPPQKPKHDEERAPPIRNAFLSGEGEDRARWGYNRQESRFVVYFAVRQKLTGAIAARDRYVNDPNTDIHTYTSELTGGVLSRHAGKIANFMKIYGAGVEAFALQIKNPLDEAKGLYALYDEKMPFVSQLS